MKDALNRDVSSKDFILNEEIALTNLKETNLKETNLKETNLKETNLKETTKSNTDYKDRVVIYINDDSIFINKYTSNKNVFNLYISSKNNIIHASTLQKKYTLDLTNDTLTCVCYNYIIRNINEALSNNIKLTQEDAERIYKTLNFKLVDTTINIKKKHDFVNEPYYSLSLLSNIDITCKNRIKKHSINAYDVFNGLEVSSFVRNILNFNPKIMNFVDFIYKTISSLIQVNNAKEEEFLKRLVYKRILYKMDLININYDFNSNFIKEIDSSKNSTLQKEYTLDIESLIDYFGIWLSTEKRKRILKIAVKYIYYVYKYGFDRDLTLKYKPNQYTSETFSDLLNVFDLNQFYEFLSDLPEEEMDIFDKYLEDNKDRFNGISTNPIISKDSTFIIGLRKDDISLNDILNLGVKGGERQDLEYLLDYLSIAINNQNLSILTASYHNYIKLCLNAINKEEVDLYPRDLQRSKIALLNILHEYKGTEENLKEYMIYPKEVSDRAVYKYISKGSLLLKLNKLSLDTLELLNLSKENDYFFLLNDNTSSSVVFVKNNVVTNCITDRYEKTTKRMSSLLEDICNKSNLTLDKDCYNNYL